MPEHKREELTGGWRRLRKVELHNSEVYFSSNVGYNLERSGTSNVHVKNKKCIHNFNRKT
jgi:hypothetical protein